MLMFSDHLLDTLEISWIPTKFCPTFECCPNLFNISIYFQFQFCPIFQSIRESRSMSQKNTHTQKKGKMSEKWRQLSFQYLKGNKKSVFCVDQSVKWYWEVNTQIYNKCNRALHILWLHPKVHKYGSINMVLISLDISFQVMQTDSFWVFNQYSFTYSNKSHQSASLLTLFHHHWKQLVTLKNGNQWKIPKDRHWKNTLIWGADRLQQLSQLNSTSKWLAKLA